MVCWFKIENFETEHKQNVIILSITNHTHLFLFLLRLQFYPLKN